MTTDTTDTHTPYKDTIIYVDMDGVLVDFQSGLNKISKELLEEYTGRYDEIPNIFSLMEPIPDAIESINKLSDMFNVYILSTAPWNNPTAWADKLSWVQKYLPKFHKRLILSHNKHLNKGDFLIDDRLANGANLFTGYHLHFNQDSNNEIDDNDDIYTNTNTNTGKRILMKDWKNVLQFFDDYIEFKLYLLKNPRCC